MRFLKADGGEHFIDVRRIIDVRRVYIGQAQFRVDVRYDQGAGMAANAIHITSRSLEEVMEEIGGGLAWEASKI